MLRTAATALLAVPLLLPPGSLSPAAFGQDDPGAAGDSRRAFPVRLEGSVTDASTGAPIPAVNVRIPGTSRGTVSNEDGRYRLLLDSASRLVVFVHLAYESDTVRLDDGTATLPLDVRLRPATLVYPEVVVLAEDPALEIIRKAIANKRRWMDLLKTYRFEAYTRQVVDRDTSVASITEAFSVGWVISGDTLRERVVQKRQTANVPMEENFAAVRRLVNFNDDRITLFRMNVNNERRSFTFTGPTAPDALDLYDYRLLRTRRVDGIEMYEIAMTPKTRLQPLFSGTITIADRSFAVVGVDLEPNETFTMPFVKEIALRYRQQFALYDSLFWMPADVRIDGGFTVSVMGIGIPRVGFRQVSSIYNYELNAPVPDSVLAQRRVTVDSASATPDTLLWRSGLVVPLTTAESEAYLTLDSTQTLERQFRPGGIIGAMSDDGEGAGDLLGLLDARFTRVEGFYLGLDGEWPTPLPGVRAGLGAGYGFSDRRGRYRISAAWRPIAGTRLTLRGEAFRRTDHAPDGGYHGTLVNSIAALADKNDGRDHFEAEGWTAGAEFASGRRFAASLRFAVQEERSMAVATDFSLSPADRPHRPNPAIADGTNRSIAASVRFGLERETLDLLTNDNLELAVEHSSPDLTGGDFDYTRLSALATWTRPLFGRNLLFPASFRVRAFAGKGFGGLPPQRVFAADARLSAYAPFGVLRGSRPREFTGDAVVAIAVEQNFRSLPFLALNLPFLYRNGVELVAHGAFAQTWEGALPRPGGWYAEAGAGISRILDLIRIDVTRRFRDPARWYLSISVASLY